MSGTVWTVEKYLEVFFPQYFDTNGPEHVPQDVLDILIDVATSARPACLNEKTQNLAQAFFTAYLIQIRNAGFSGIPMQRGEVASEKEGDVSINYHKFDISKDSKSPPLTAWDQWYALWKRCLRGAVLTRYGDPIWSRESETPIKDGKELSLILTDSAVRKLESV